VNYLVSPLCEKSFHTDLQAAQRKGKAKKIYTRYIQEIYTNMYKKYEKYTHAFEKAITAAKQPKL